jgi:single-stranded-DNA-specific exonuclease
MRWKLRSVPDESAVAALSAATQLPPVVARMLVMRGLTDVEEAQSFLSPSLAALHSPYDMLGMAPALERVWAAAAAKEKILIYGDYDVDGTLAVVILKTAIELVGGLCEFHVPHRLREGYGMKDEVIERAAAGGIRLIISVDTGIRAFAAAETARRIGVDLIVTDHHLPQGDELPRALAVLNPNQSGCHYRCKSLCGAGVAFKLAQAILEKGGLARLLPSFLKMVAIATIADAVPLVGENRVFAKLGLEGLRQPVNPGLKALLEVAQLNHRRALAATEVAFRLAPRLNAAGRMDVARDVIDLFCVRNEAQAKEIADRLNRLNLERQQEEQRIVAEIESRLASDEALRNAWCLVVDGEGWHKGVIGIAASRMVERYCRPALVIARDGPEAQGSARTIEAFHMLDALESCAPLFTRFGGHAHAAGFALPSERIPQLRAALETRARACLRSEDLQLTLRYDAEIQLSEITPELYAQLRRLEPFGMANPQPVMLARNVRLGCPPRIVREKHLKLRLGQADVPPPGVSSGAPARYFNALGWRMAERIQSEPLGLQDVLDVAFILVENSHPEFGGLELSLCDYRLSAHRR